MKQDLIDIALKSCFEAADAVMKVYNGDDFEIQLKSDHSPLTKADLLAHQIIKANLVSTGIPLLSEEGKHLPHIERKNWERLWIVDPIDGTKEFIKKSDEFTINIALVENGTPTFGVVYAPALQLIYWGGSAYGSFKLENVSSYQEFLDVKENAISLPGYGINENYTITVSRSHLSEKTKNFIEKKSKELENVLTIFKGSSLKICMIAEGSANCYPKYGPTMEWDTAAGHAVCLGAKKNIYDLDHKPLRYNKADLLNNNFICS